MAKIAVLERKCTGCGLCQSNCPFGAIEMVGGKPELNAACKVCGICVKNCPEKAIIKLETKVNDVDKSAWKDILVFTEVSERGLHPVGLELIGKAHELAAPLGYSVKAVLVGSHISRHAEELQHYGLSEIAVYDDPTLAFFRADAYASCVEDYIRFSHPSVVLVGATALGRSLAPRLSTRFRTGLTADCTQLELKENSDLVQIRPAFGGNIMAQIVTPHTRPQFATVRYKVMNPAVRRDDASGQILARKIPAGVSQSRASCISVTPVPQKKSISDADILVVGGRGLQKESDLDMIRELASLLGGDWATTRPLVEKGWTTNDRQIGLSGRTVRPQLIITCGVSGAIQFTSCMNASDHIVAINTDRNAPIFDVAHIAIIDDLYKVIPELIQKLKEAQT
ncbi:MAG: FAD-binding protein [Clostridia bacterium]|nr:FAD-binding protein [Clostridia bacterium]